LALLVKCPSILPPAVEGIVGKSEKEKLLFGVGVGVTVGAGVAVGVGLTVGVGVGVGVTGGVTGVGVGVTVGAGVAVGVTGGVTGVALGVGLVVKIGVIGVLLHRISLQMAALAVVTTPAMETNNPATATETKVTFFIFLS